MIEIFVNTTLQNKVLGDYIYTVVDLTNLSVNNYKIISKLLDSFISRKNNTINSSLTKSELKQLNVELAAINKQFNCRYLTFDVVEINKTTAEEFSDIVTSTIDLEIDKLIISTRCLEYEIYSINKLNLIKHDYTYIKNSYTVDSRHRDLCFVSSLLSEQKYLETILNTPYAQYTWEKHQGNLCLLSVKDMLTYPQIIYRKEIIQALPKIFMEYYYRHEELAKYYKYLKVNPKWWFLWSGYNFKDYLTDKELKDLHWYNRYITQSKHTNIRKTINNGYKRKRG